MNNLQNYLILQAYLLLILQELDFILNSEQAQRRYWYVSTHVHAKIKTTLKR